MNIKNHPNQKLYKSINKKYFNQRDDNFVEKSNFFI